METFSTYSTPALEFGSAASREVGHDLVGLIGASGGRVLLITDPGVTATGHPARIVGRVRDYRSADCPDDPDTPDDLARVFRDSMEHG